MNIGDDKLLANKDDSGSWQDEKGRFSSFFCCCFFVFVFFVYLYFESFGFTIEEIF